MEPFDQTILEPAQARGSNWEIAEEPTSRLSVLTIVLGVFGCWVASLLGPLSLAFPVIAIGLFLALLAKRQIVAAFVVLAFMPTSLFFAMTVLSYSQGTAKIEMMGPYYPRNLDPQLRCGHITGGCFPSGNEWIPIATNNLTLKLLTGCLGPMPGAYDGPYPSQQEAIQAISLNGEQIPARELEKDSIEVDGQVISLDQEIGKDLSRSLPQFNYMPGGPYVTATLLERRCLIIRFPDEDASTASTPAATIVLLDTDTGRPFAFYHEGPTQRHRPYIEWKRPPY